MYQLYRRWGYSSHCITNTLLLSYILVITTFNKWYLLGKATSFTDISLPVPWYIWPKLLTWWAYIAPWSVGETSDLERFLLKEVLLGGRHWVSAGLSQSSVGAHRTRKVLAPQTHQTSENDTSTLNRELMFAIHVVSLQLQEWWQNQSKENSNAYQMGCDDTRIIIKLCTHCHYFWNTWQVLLLNHQTLSLMFYHHWYKQALSKRDGVEGFITNLNTTIQFPTWTPKRSASNVAAERTEHYLIKVTLRLQSLSLLSNFNQMSLFFKKRVRKFTLSLRKMKFVLSFNFT